MKQSLVTMAVLLAVGWLAAPTAAQPPERDRGGPNPERRQRLMEEFDADEDGELSDEERATARRTMQQRRERAQDRLENRRRDRDDREDAPDARRDDRPGPSEDRAFDRERRRERLGRRDGGFGVPPEGRRGPGGPPTTAGPGPFIDPRVLFEQFDENNDDQLSREEFLSLTIEIQKIRAERFAQFGSRGPRGPRGGPGWADLRRADLRRGRGDGPPAGRPRFDRGRGQGRDDEDRPRRRQRPSLEDSANEPAPAEAAQETAPESSV